MKPTARTTLLAAALSSLAACAPSTVTGNVGAPDAAPASDAPTGADATPADVTGADATTPDGAVVQPDASPVDDVAAVDATSADVTGPDATSPDATSPDATSPDASPADVTRPDGSTDSLAGRWRVVGWDYTNAAGVTTRLTDRDTPVRDPATGTTTPFRANGVFFLRPTRLSVAFGTLGGQHFYATTTSTGGADYSAWGVTAPGLLDEAAGTFTVVGGMTVFRFARNADGTISYEQTNGTERSRTTLARAPSSPALSNLNLVGYAQIREPARARPLLHPRFALLWDRPGGGAPVETHGSALAFRGAYAAYAVVQAGAPPAEVQGRALGVPVAVAYTFVYDDLNDNGRFDAGDPRRGFGPLAVAWRGEGAPTADFEASALSELQPGWQVAHLHQDYTRSLGSNAQTVVPFDTTVPVSPDTPVLEEPLRDPLPGLVR